MKEINGDLVKMAFAGEVDCFAHGCNCFHSFGSGIARTVRDVFPAAYRADLETRKGDEAKLGTCSVAQCGNVTVINAYTQFRYGRGKRHADYDAIRSCMRWIKDNYSGKHIGLPLIGAGLAGGDWKIIKAIIADELSGENVTIVHFK